MNITAINASSTLNRPRVPRNNDNVSFGRKFHKPTKQTFQNGKTHVKNFFVNTGHHIQNAWRTGKKHAGEFIEKNKGVKGIKLAAIGLTAVIAGAFAIKEIHDIFTGSNPER